LASTPGSGKAVLAAKPSKSRIIAAAGLFAALSILLTSISQFLGLNFPIIPYLQFDLGEVAILLAFLLFGPVPAIFSAFVEFITLMLLGQNAPIGPILKIMAILSTMGGLWAGIFILRKIIVRPKRGTLFLTSLALGVIFRAVLMTIPNYYLIVYVYTVKGIVGFVSGAFGLVGISMTTENALQLILEFTALFNALQLLFAFTVAYLLIRTPQLNQLFRTNRMTWFESIGSSSRPNQGTHN
jgi:riboflavin transporter FmnP